MSPQPEIAAPKHLVVRLPNPLGDAVMAVPALRALREALPDTRITWVGRRAPQAALDGLPYRDGVMPLEGNMAKGVFYIYRAAKMLARLEADATVLMPNSISCAMSAWWAGESIRVGIPRDYRTWLLTHRVEPPRDPERPAKRLPRPMTEHYQDLVAPFGAVDDGRGLELRATAFDEARAAHRLRGVAAGAAIVGLNPGAAFGPSKLLSPEQIGRAVAALRKRTEVVPLVLCGPGEEALGAATARAIGDDCVTTHDDLPDIGELKALLRRCRVVLTSDAGPRHMAEAMGVPTVVWFGPTDPRWSGHSNAVAIRNEALDCLSCHLKVCPLEGHPCMNGLDPEEIADAALAALRSAP